MRPGIGFILAKPVSYRNGMSWKALEFCKATCCLVERCVAFFCQVSNACSLKEIKDSSTGESVCKAACRQAGICSYTVVSCAVGGILSDQYFTSILQFA